MQGSGEIMSENPRRIATLGTLSEGMPIPFGGDRLTFVPGALAEAFRPGDRLIVVQDTGDLLHVPGSVFDEVSRATAAAAEAFSALAEVRDSAISEFFEALARRIESDAVWGRFAAANAADATTALPCMIEPVCVSSNSRL